MRRFSLFAALCVICLVAADAPDPAFDAKSLAGWDYLPANWKAEDGMIVGSSDGSLKFNTFLCSQKKYKDFEMTFKVRLTSDKKGDANTANSGVQIRSEVIDREKWIVKGPQCDMGSKYWGSLYGEKFGKGMMKASDFVKVQPTFKPDEFNDYFIKVIGKRVTIAVNGVTTVDEEFADLPAEGIIALQIHQGPPMQAAFKTIKFREWK